MDIEVINRQLSQLVNKIGADVESKMSAPDINNPDGLLQAQFAIQQYSVFVGYQSAVIKAIKDMISGIIQKI
ncbi:EscF/YscF/HrpA family type III secretion system needle major subunit [Burkholderia sp. Bp9126]|nr:EscF/YscF/HrpA family type III secretion system needle major subunit [Burkholderia sp. Bp9126]